MTELSWVAPIPPRAVQWISSRERDVLRLVAEGLSNREIAEELILSPNTVRTYVEDALRSMGARNRSHAAVMAQRYGWIR